MSIRRFSREEEDLEEVEEEEEWEDEEEDDTPPLPRFRRKPSGLARTMREDDIGELDEDMEQLIRKGAYIPRPRDPWSAHLLYQMLVDLGDLEA
jgi:hypothetical protein